MLFAADVLARVHERADHPTSVKCTRSLLAPLDHASAAASR